MKTTLMALLGVCLLLGNLGNARTTPDVIPITQRPNYPTTQSPNALLRQRGFLTVGKDGHFHWQDGARARFWGINVSSTRLNVPPERIEEVVETFARAGLNMVRLEAIDNRNCLLGKVDAPDSRHLDPQYLDCLDHWMDALRRHGIYYYLDLLDFRTFKAGDDVPNADKLDRGARPYALFDRHLIELQKEYATQLLTHRNPYSGLRPIEDPALALVEICNEHGFFLYPEKLETLVEPYRINLQTLWNNRRGEGVKGRRGAKEQGTDPTPNAQHPTPNTPSPFHPFTPSRQSDGVRFLVELQRAYFREMRAHLRTIGLRVPVTAVVSNNIVPDVASAAQECDFTAENWYGEGVHGAPNAPGMSFHGNRNPLRDDSAGGFAPFTAALRWNNKPVVIREWDVTWPNRYRAASVPEALAYAALQDYDAMLLFGYQTNRAPNGAEADALNHFATQADPTVWGLYALAGQAFLRGDIRPANRALALVYPPERLARWPNGLGDLHRAAWTLRLSSFTQNALQLAGNTLRRTPAGTGRDRQTLRALLTNSKTRHATSPLVSGIWRSDTGEITRYVHEGRLEVATPRLRMIAGEFVPGRVYNVGGLRFSTPTQIGALLAISLDGLPLERSRHWFVKMVSRAENTGQVFEKAPPGSPGEWILRAHGAAPVLTFGRPSAQPTRLWLTQKATKPTLSVGMQDGTWELEFKDGHAEFACDTPNVKWVVG